MIKKSLLLLLFSLSACNVDLNTENKSEENSQNSSSEIKKNDLKPVFHVNFEDSMDDKVNGLKAEISGEPLKIKDHNGNENKAYSFDGEKDYLKYDFDLNQEKIESMSIAAWVRSTDDPENFNKDQQQIISHDDGSFDRSLGIDSRGDENTEFGWSTFAGNCSVIGSLPIKKDEWVFLVVNQEKDETDSESRNKYNVSLHANGKKLEAKECSFNTGYEYLWLAGNPGHGEYFKGDIDEVMIFDRILTDSEIKSLANQ